MPEPLPLAASFQFCRGVTRAAARNFYYALRLLPSAKRDAICALYAFMRHADDLSDSGGDLASRQRALAGWRASLDRALAGDAADHPALPALAHTVHHYAVPKRLLHDLVSGTEMDLSICRYETFADVREYCYRVAGTVGLCCISVFGYEDSRAPLLAEKLGLAFQLTNILRDVVPDMRMGRIYLPQEDLRRFQCGAALEQLRLTPEFAAMMRFQAARAWESYEEGIGLLPLVSEDSRAALWALARIYSGLLDRIAACHYDVFTTTRVRLSAAEKTWVMLRARLGWWPRDYGIEDSDRDRRGTGGSLLRRRAG